MFKIVKDKFLGFLYKNINKTLYLKNLVNKNKYLMKKLVTSDSSFLKVVDSEALTSEIIDIALENNISFSDLIYIFNKNNFELEYDVIKKICQIDGRFFQFVDEKSFTFELFQIASSHENPKKRFNFNYNWLPIHDNINREEIIKFVKYDGRLIGLFKHHLIDKEIIELAFSNPDPSKIPSIDNLEELKYDPKLMDYICSFDGRNFIYAAGPAMNAELLKKCLNFPDPEKRLKFEDLEKVSFRRLKYDDIKDLCEEDKRWFDFVLLESIEKKELIELLKKGNIKLSAFELSKKIKDQDIIEAVCEAVNNDYYSLKELERLFRMRDIDYNFVQSSFFEIVGKKICSKNEIDYDWFKYNITRSVKNNSAILRTVNYRIFDKRFRNLYGKDFERLLIITAYTNVQEDIVNMGYPKDKNGEIDHQLGEKQIQLFIRMLEVALNNQDQSQSIKEWIPYFSELLDASKNYQTELANFARHIEELDDQMIKDLTNYIIGGHSFNIKTIDDLKRIEDIRKKWIERNLKKNRYDLKYAVLEKLFGIGEKTANKLYESYCEGVLLQKEQFPKEIVELFKTIKLVFETKNNDKLLKTVSEFDDNFKIPENTIINLQSKIKSKIVRAYNQEVFKIADQEPSDRIDGVSVYKAAGEDGSKEFSILLSALNAFSWIPSTDRDFNFKDDWNKPTIGSRCICCSYIGNQFIGTAPIRTAVLGFTDLDEGSLLLSGNRDIDSVSSVFNVYAASESYFFPKDQLKKTCEKYNEVDIDRLNGLEKKQPSYVVLICDDYNETKLKYNIMKRRKLYNFKNELTTNDEKQMYFALRAAKDFNIPIVVVERSKIAKKQHEQIFSSLENFKNDDDLNRDKIRTYYHDFINVFQSNYSSYKNTDFNKYFNQKKADKIVTEINKKIDSCMKTNPVVAYILIDELKKIVDDNLNSNYYTAFNKSNFEYIYRSNMFKLKENGSIAEIDNLFDIDKNDDYSLEFSQYMKEELKGIEQYQFYYELLDDMTISGINSYSNLIAEENSDLKDVLLFSTMIGKAINLSDDDLDIVKIAAVNLNERNIEATFVNDNDEKILRSVLEFINSEDDQSLDTICQKNGISSEIDLERTTKICNCLADGRELSKTKYFAKSDNFTNVQSLHFLSSKKLIRFGMALNEFRAMKKIRELASDDDYSSLLKEIAIYKSPKVVVGELEHDKANGSEIEVEKSHGNKR